MIGRPSAAEHHAYYGRYVTLVPGDDLLAALSESPLSALLRAADPSLASYAYADGKWTLSGLAQHVIDTERVFATRALRIARGDTTPQPGFDQDVFAAATSDRPLDDVANELDAVRASTIALFRSLDDQAVERMGPVSGHPMSARASRWILAGHERHHAEIARDRYLGR